MGLGGTRRSRVPLDGLRGLDIGLGIGLSRPRNSLGAERGWGLDLRLRPGWTRSSGSVAAALECWPKLATPLLHDTVADDLFGDRPGSAVHVPQAGQIAALELGRWWPWLRTAAGQVGRSELRTVPSRRRSCRGRGTDYLARRALKPVWHDTQPVWSSANR